MVDVQVIVLNGGSSAGKSTLATLLQEQLAGTWLTLGVDDLIHALSHGPTDTTAGGTLEFRSDGSIVVAEAFRRAERAWFEGLGAMARAGTGVVVDEVFLDGGQGQGRLAAALQGIAVVWVGVRCDPDVAEAREIQRDDRFRGLARDQAARVHEGVRYDLIVDTTTSTAAQCAAVVMAGLAGTQAREASGSGAGRVPDLRHAPEGDEAASR